MSKQVILTGLRANSEFHIGNYLGGILPVVELQQRHAGEYQVNMFVPDLHSITTPIDFSQLYQQTIDNLRVFVAAGLDIQNPDTYIYRQSFISPHSELAWILDCFTGFGELARMTQFKDKTRQASDIYKQNISSSGSVFDNPEDEKTFQGMNFGEDRVSVGLFNYPVLMAADILLYDASYIPVGDDQKQHIELVRDLAIRLNRIHGEQLFVVPEPWQKQLEFTQRDTGARIRSLRHPDKKMSKSVSDPSGTILLSDNPDEAAKKIMRAETDSFGEIRYDFTERPGISNLLQILALLSGKSQQDVNAEWEGKDRYGDLKQAVAEQVKNFLADIQDKLSVIDDSVILDKLSHDEDHMNKVAQEKLRKVQQAVGLRK